MSDVAAQAIVCACILVFAAAVAGKLDSWAEWVGLTSSLPGGRRTQVIVRQGVPIGETAIIILCVAVPVAGLGAASATLGLFAFGVHLLSKSLGGHECNCFGAIAPARISHRLAARNAVLCVFAGLAAYKVSMTALNSLPFADLVIATVSGVGLLMLEQLWQLHKTAWRVPAQAAEAEAA